MKDNRWRTSKAVCLLKDEVKIYRNFKISIELNIFFNYL